MGARVSCFLFNLGRRYGAGMIAVLSGYGTGVPRWSLNDFRGADTCRVGVRNKQPAEHIQ
jgi:hypothetical protein